MVPATGGEAFSPPIAREYAGFEAGMDYSRRHPAVPNGYAWGRNISTESGVAMPAGRLHTVSLSTLSQTMGEVQSGLEYNNRLYFFGGGTAIGNTPAAANNVFTVVQNLAAIEPTFAAGDAMVFLDKVYIGGRTATGIAYLWEMNTSEAFTNASIAYGASGAKRWRLGSLYRVNPATGNGDETLIGTDTGSSFKFNTSTTPLNDDDWSASYQVGPTTYAILSIACSAETAWFCKQEGIYRVNRQGHAANIVPGLKNTLSGNNGVASLILNGRLYVSNYRGVGMFTGLQGQVNPVGLISPGGEIAAEHPVWGQPYTMTPDGDDVIAAFYNPSNQTSYICRGRPREDVPGAPGIKRFIWHGPLRTIEDERVTYLLVTAPFGSPRLWIWTINPDTDVVKGYWQDLPRANTHYQEYLTPGSPSIEWETDAAIYLGLDDWDRGHQSQKVLDRISVIGEDLSGHSLMNVYGAADQGAYTQFGVAVTQNGYQTTKISSSTTARLWQFRVDFVGSTTTPPILRALVPRAEVTVEPTEMLGPIPVIFGDGVALRAGHTGKDNRNPEVVWRQIQARMGSTPITLVDWYGRHLTVTLRQEASWIEHEERTDEQWSIIALLTFTVKRRAWQWGDGTKYRTSGEQWGVG